MRMLARALWRSPRRRHDYWPALGLAAGLVLLAGCGLSSSSGGGAGTGNPTPSQVTVTTSQQRYTPSDTVIVTITNGLATRILAADHQSNCTIVRIELQSGQAWQPQNPCKLMSPTRLIPLDPGSATTQQLQPIQQAGATRWTSGTYRIVLAYRQNPTDADTTIYSASFDVG